MTPHLMRTSYLYANEGRAAAAVLGHRLLRARRLPHLRPLHRQVRSLRSLILKKDLKFLILIFLKFLILLVSDLQSPVRPALPRNGAAVPIRRRLGRAARRGG